MSEELTIEKGVPIPHVQRRRSFLCDIAAAMEVSDSVIVPSLAMANTLIQALKYRKKKGSMRKQGDKIRVWRIE